MPGVMKTKRVDGHLLSQRHMQAQPRNYSLQQLLAGSVCCLSCSKRRRDDFTGVADIPFRTDIHEITRAQHRAIYQRCHCRFGLAVAGNEGGAA